MIEELKKIFPIIRVEDCEMRFAKRIYFKDRYLIIDDEHLRYMPITHTEETDKIIETECECCGGIKKEYETKVIVDVEVKDLTKKQKKEQLNKIVKIIEKYVEPNTMP